MKKSRSTKLLALLLCALMTLPLFACGNEESTTAVTDAPTTEAPTDEPTEAPATDAPTAEPTEAPATDAPTAEPTEAPATDAPTAEPTEAPATDAPTDEPTEAPATEAPTDEPTEAPATEAPTAEPTETPTTEATTETPTEPVSEPETDPVVDLGNYENGAPVEGAGASWGDDAFASKENTVDTSAAQDITAADLLALLANKDGLKAGEVYKVTEALVLTGDTNYYGNMAAIIAEGGISIVDVSNIVIKDLIIIGSITVDGSSDITLVNTDIKGEHIAVRITETCNNIKIESSIISAVESPVHSSTSTALVSAGSTVSVYECMLASTTAIRSSGSDFTVQNSKLSATACGIRSTGRYAIVRSNDITVGAHGIGVDFGEGSYNGLIAQNVIKDVKNSVTVTGGYNCAVLLNSAIYIGGFNNKNLYVVKNSLGGIIDLRDNNYLLCDENTFLNDGKAHTPISLRNENYNGDTIQDVSARTEYGANEELLPHTNKDLFVAMERRTEVTDLSFTEKSDYINYIRSNASSGSTVIVPPGAYSASSTLGLSAAHKNTEIYAFGVYYEKAVAKDTSGAPSSVLSDALGSLINISGNSIHINGLTLGYDFQSSGQVYVLEKFVDDTHGNCIRVVSGAGYIEAFAGMAPGSDPDLFTSPTGGCLYVCRGDSMYNDSTYPALKHIKTESNGTIIYKVINDIAYNGMEPGDIITCRLGGENATSLSLNATDILMKDCVLYGYAAALAISAGGREAENIRLERFHNTTHSAPVIDKKTYQWYKSLERKYDLTEDGGDPLAEGAKGLEVYIDENENYRGCLPRLGSVDATHISGAAQGVSATSCIFEQMCDDGSNQRSSSARIAGYKVNGDGTTTLYFKGSLTYTYYTKAGESGAALNTPTGDSMSFKAGDTMFAYASEGKTLIEAAVVSDSKKAGDISEEVHITHTDSDENCVCDLASCKALLHYDNVNNETGAITKDCKCDICDIKVHTDYTESSLHYGAGDKVCNRCSTKLIDSDGDGFTDESNPAYIITDMASNVKYDPDTSMLTFDIYSYNKVKACNYVITCSTVVKQVTVSTDDVDFSTLEGQELTDNDYFMLEKIICDNLSLNSGDFTFDNVLIQNFLSRGVLMKTTDSTLKHCTVRNINQACVLMSIETTWGESSVPKNITIEGCLFQNTGYLRGKDQFKHAAIALLGLGDTQAPVVVSENTLPSRNIKIIGNKFDGILNNYAITISAAQDIVIKDNVFIARDPVETDKYDVPRAIYINGAMNIDISGNTYENFGELAINKIIIGWNYKDLHGSDVEGIIPEEKEEYPET